MKIENGYEISGVQLGGIGVDIPAHTMTLADRGPVERLKPQWDTATDKATAFLQDVLGTEYFVDEVALLFKDSDVMRDFIERAVLEPNVEHFNAAIDGVSTTPLKSSYSVRYDFLRLRDANYRVECMRLLTGHSPLHEAVKANALVEPATVHLSFKVPDMFSYNDIVERMKDADLTLAQHCESSYGTFSYWNQKDTATYLKPRVNRRDR